MCLIGKLKKCLGTSVVKYEQVNEWLINCIVFHAVSTLCQPYNEGEWGEWKVRQPDLTRLTDEGFTKVNPL